MKRIITSILRLSLLSALMLISACSEDEDPPLLGVIGFQADADNPFKITFSVQTENVTEYSWDFGDDAGTSTEVNPTYTYADAGAYEVVLTATGQGGTTTASVTVTIATSISEMLSGGPNATDGKTWVLSTSVTTGSDGAGHVSNLMNILFGAPDNALSSISGIPIGLEAEYDNEFTFYDDGSYSIDPVNGSVLSSVVHARVLEEQSLTTITDVSESTSTLPMAAATFTPATNATWSLSHDDHIVTAYNEIGVPADQIVSEEITFDFPGNPSTKQARIVLSDNQFLGFWGGTPTYIIKSISAERMQIAVPINGLVEYYPAPTLMITFTFVPK
ncbi:MAG: PKD domain-containing protein [Reichenbachiella sp.]|uniref:PKD domain-containing protein n=1 Tax=Reichenbachiella sp. TaxID=2184521 RepID=UPI0032971CA1